MQMPTKPKTAQRVIPANRNYLLVALLLLCAVVVFLPQFSAAEIPRGASDRAAATVPLTPEERRYLEKLGPITICPDPDWAPYEQIDAQGNFVGIAADLLHLLEERLGIRFVLIKVKEWDQAVALSQAGKVLLLPFLNQTPKREEWLTFTEPLFEDPNVYITREEHPFITNAAALENKIIAIPDGTSVEEKIRRDFPRLRLLRVGSSESDVFKAVAERRADLTLRSLTIAAYTIRNQGLFTLKIAGQAPDEYTNRLRIGVLKSEPMLRDILNKGIATILPREREAIVNRHIHITVVKPVDYGFILRIVAVLVALIGLSLYWNLRLKRSAAALRESERSKSVLLSNLPGIAYRCRLDRDWTMEFISEGCVQLTGYRSDDLVQNHTISFNDLILPEYRDQLWDAWQQAVQERRPVQLEYRIMSADGDEKWVMEQGVPIFDEQGRVTALEGIIVDISEMKQIQQQILHLASYDNLTDLPNRALFSDRVEQALLVARRRKEKLAIFFVDLDKFKLINDELGHETGDLLLQAVARRMEGCVRESDTVARLGGDEFAILLPTVSTAQDACSVAEKILSALSRPFVMESCGALSISCSIGVALYPDHGDSERDLLRAADEAMYRVKKHGRNAVELYSQADLHTFRSDAQGAVIRLVWRSDYLSGEQRVDQDHQELFRLANQLLELFVGQEGDAGCCAERLDELLQHIRSHFEYEDGLLRRIRYDGAEEHIRQHALLLTQAQHLRQSALERQIHIGELIDFLAIKVVNEHLLTMDLQYFAQLYEQPGDSVDQDAGKPFA